jgi:hypothetical protein
MSEQQEIDPKLELAAAVARGSSVRRWAMAHNVPCRTAHHWAEDRNFKAEVTRIRRANVDRVIGIASARAPVAMKRIDHLSQNAQSESVQLRAAQFIVSDGTNVTRLSNLEQRMDCLEGELSAQRAE